MTDARALMFAAGTSAASASAAAPEHPGGERAQYPARMAVDFTQLRPHALQRYLAFHGIPAPPGSSREDLAVLVARHFGEACLRADEAKSISSFVSYVTQDGKAGGGNGAMKRRKVIDEQSSAPVDVASGGRAGGAIAADQEQFIARELDVEDVDATDAYAFHDELPVRRRGYSDEYDDGDMEVVADENHAGNESFDDGDDSFDEQLGGSSSARRGGGRSSGTKHGNARSSSGSSSTKAEHKKKKAHRKARLYCVCKGASFGDMIACDNKKCLDRSNWYHMSCVGLDPAKPPPDTWFCPLCRGKDLTDIPENQYRKPVASVTYGDMISHALTVLPDGKGTFKEICDFVEKQYESQLNWKLESDQRKSPVWKSSVRKILFSNMRFRKHPDDKGLFCLAA